ncbi:uncharacterized protein LOC129294691 [Prosopis cineraria]|uniref:uncharacterized protein LOC129294691 n=1 Tax=Prosopis cineraria TaxID=364024 RepID=UPI00240F1722|nr:uncharacterized protein LOC129294691 [Prosopis cineraria]
MKSSKNIKAQMRLEKLFEAEHDVLKALRGGGIQIMVGIPNEMLSLLGSSPSTIVFYVKVVRISESSRALHLPRPMVRSCWQLIVSLGLRYEEKDEPLSPRAGDLGEIRFP